MTLLQQKGGFSEKLLLYNKVNYYYANSKDIGLCNLHAFIVVHALIRSTFKQFKIHIIIIHYVLSDDSG